MKRLLHWLAWGNHREVDTSKIAVHKEVYAHGHFRWVSWWECRICGAMCDTPWWAIKKAAK